MQQQLVQAVRKSSLARHMLRKEASEEHATPRVRPAQAEASGMANEVSSVRLNLAKAAEEETARGT